MRRSVFVMRRHVFVMRRSVFVMRRHVFVMRRNVFVMRRHVFVMRRSVFAMRRSAFVKQRRTVVRLRDTLVMPTTRCVVARCRSVTSATRYVVARDRSVTSATRCAVARRRFVTSAARCVVATTESGTGPIGDRRGGGGQRLAMLRNRAKSTRRDRWRLGWAWGETPRNMGSKPIAGALVGVALAKRVKTEYNYEAQGGEHARIRSDRRPIEKGSTWPPVSVPCATIFTLTASWR